MKYTVITVTYNCVDTIEQTIKSVISQDYRDIEYIIVDGDSTDGTKDILDRYAEYFSVYVSEKDTGVFNAMNKALSYASGDVVSFLNGDDYYISNDIFSYIENIFCDTEIEIVDALTNVQGLGIYMHDNWETLFQRMILHHPAMFVRKSVFDKIGVFNEEYRAAADYDWSVRAYLAGVKIKRVYKCTTYFRTGGESSKDYGILEAYKIAKKSLLQTKKWDLLDETREMYHENFRNVIFCETLLHHSLEFTKKLKNLLGAKCVVWGTGVWAENCSCLLYTNDIEILYYIDSNPRKQGETKYDIPIKSFDRNEVSTRILISTWKYELEIMRILEHEGLIRGKDFVIFSDLETLLMEYCEQFNGIKAVDVVW